MAFDATPQKSYVRFYLAVVSQLESAYASLSRLAEASQRELAPLREGLEPVGLAALAEATAAPPPLPAALAELVRPEDPENLAGLTDVYEVVGRFTFEGEAGENLRRVQALVSEGRNRVLVEERRLDELARLPELAKATAERLRAEELERARRLREAGMQRLEPQGEVVLQRTRQTQEAMRSVPTPELDVHETAADDYRRFAHKLLSLYQTCLPYLRNSIGTLWGTVGREPPQSFPDELPLVRELPPELLVIATTGSDELAEVERSLAALDEEEAQLKRTKDELATKLARLEGELAATAVRDQEVSTDLDAARGLLEYVLAGQRLDELRAGLAEVEARREQRVRVHGEAVSNVRRIEVGLTALEVEIEARTTELAALDQEHAALQKAEPLLFGKDEWRTKLRGLGEKRDERRAQLEQHVGAQNQLKIDLATGQVAVQTAEAELALVERLGLDVRAELSSLEASREATGQKLGRLRPLRPLPTSEIEPLVAALEQKRAELAHTSERLKGEQRRAREDGVRVLARQKQIEQSRREGQARVESAKVAASEGMLAAQRRLAMERKEAVREHVAEVLGALERSLAQVGTVFVDPAREALLAATEPDFSRAEVVREAGLVAAPVVEKLVRERKPDLEAIDRLLAQIQTEFCDAAERACRAAWL